MPTPERIRDLIREARAGRLPPPAPENPLPGSKSEHPKLLALDCNQWVALARAHFGRSPNANASAALAAVVDAVTNGRLLIAIHFINAIEAMQRSNPDSRARLVHFMVGISGNWFVRPASELAEMELREAVLRSYPGAAGTPSPVRSSLLTYGVPGMFGPPTPAMSEVFAEVGAQGLGEMLHRFNQSPEASVELLVDQLRRNSAVEQGRALEDSGASLMQLSREADASLTPKRRRRLEYANLWRTRMGDRLRVVLAELSVDLEGFHEWLDQADNVELFWDDVPCMQVLLALEIESAKNRSRAIEPNDLRDMALYEACLPYANIVVTEKYWEDRIRQGKVAEKYGTRVIRRLEDLPAALAAERCTSG